MSSVRFIPISGAFSQDPLCYLLKLDEVNILLDCGSNHQLDMSSVHIIENHIDAILISHSDLAHMGALAYLYKYFNLNCQIFATLPVQTLAQISLKDGLISKKFNQDYTLFTFEDIDKTFEKVVPLRYSQPFQLSGKCNGITITAFSAGHSVGGTIWKIKKDTDDIIYAVDYNHKKERTLNGTVLHVGLDQLTRPSLLITDAYNSLNVQSNRKISDNTLISSILETLHGQGTVLIPVDCSTRVLELAYLLDQFWTSQHISYPLIFLSNQGTKALNIAKTMLEWFGDAISHAFATTRQNPFEFGRLKISNDINQASDPALGPKVILVSTSSFSTGFSYQLLNTLCTDPRNLLILPGETDSPSEMLYNYWLEQNNHKTTVQMNLKYPTVFKHKENLQGLELEQYLKHEQEKKLAETAEAEAQKRLLPGFESDPEDFEELQIDSHFQDQFDVYIKDSIQQSGFFKSSHNFKMFPVHDFRTKYDDYGEIIDPEMFIKSEYQIAIAQAIEAESIRDQKKDIEAVIEVPFKYVEEKVELLFNCKLVYIDFEGRSDGKSIKNIISQVFPRNLILIHGDEKSTNDLYESCREDDNLTCQVFAPRVGELINVANARNTFQITLSDSIMSTLNSSTKGEYTLSYIKGIVKAPQEKEDMEVDEDDEDSSRLVLEPLPIVVPHKPIIIGDMKLAEFRKILANEGYITDFVGGVIFLTEIGMIIKKTGTGRILLEGRISPDYYLIRELVYKQHRCL